MQLKTPEVKEKPISDRPENGCECHCHKPTHAKTMYCNCKCSCSTPREESTNYQSSSSKLGANVEGWEKEFEELPEWETWRDTPPEKEDYQYDLGFLQAQIKIFISNLLRSERKRLVEEIKKKVKEELELTRVKNLKGLKVIDQLNDIFDFAFDDVLEYLEEVFKGD